MKNPVKATGHIRATTMLKVIEVRRSVWGNKALIGLDNGQKVWVLAGDRIEINIDLDVNPAK